MVQGDWRSRKRENCPKASPRPGQRSQTRYLDWKLIALLEPIIQFSDRFFKQKIFTIFINQQFGLARAGGLIRRNASGTPESGILDASIPNLYGC